MKADRLLTKRKKCFWCTGDICCPQNGLFLKMKENLVHSKHLFGMSKKTKVWSQEYNLLLKLHVYD